MSSQPCNITFITGSVAVESQTLCGYANYHLFMFLVCGTAALFFLLVSLVLLARYGPNPPPPQAAWLDKCNWWTIVFLCHMAGFEGALLIFYLCVFCVLLYAFLSFCTLELWKATRVVAQQLDTPVRLFGPATNAVVQDAGCPPPAVVPQVVVIQHNDCCICLESGTSADGQWMTSPCGHVFHVGCIARWRPGTCPLCRKLVWM
jgi:hypothetical protein